MPQSFRFLLASAGLLAACQPQAKPEKTARSAPASAEAPVLTAATAAPARLTLDFLAANNLAPLWQSDYDRKPNDSSRPVVLDGFYGAEHRHISVLLERVRRDAAQPNVYQVQGRTRYKKNITPFEGTITVDNLKPLKAYLDLDSAEEARARAYTATARFVLREDPAANGTGTYQGTALMDFYQLASGKLELVQQLFAPELPTGGGGLLFRGQWTSHRTARRQAVAFATYAQAVQPDAMNDLYIGERGETLNPKYARLDWSEAWENEEWWAKPAKPALSL